MSCPKPTIVATLLATLVTAATARAQEGAILGALADAQRALDERRAEDAVLLVRDARAMLARVRDDGVRAELRTAVAELRAKADPIASSLDDAAGEAAAALVAAAAAYRERGWLRSARDLLQRAAGLSAEVARAPLAEVQAALDPVGADADADRDTLARWFADGERVDGPDGWVRTATSMRAPPLPENGPTAIFVSALRAQPEMLRIALQVDAAVDGGFGVVFGYRHHLDYHALQVTIQGGDLGIQLALWRGGAYETLAERWVPRAAAELPAAPGAAPGRRPLRLELVVDDGSIEARFGKDGKEKLAATSTLPRGFVGLQAWRRGPDTFRPEFSELTIDAVVAR